MAAIRIEALRSLAAYIEAQLPGFGVGVCVGQRPFGSRQSFPNLSVYPFRWRYFPHQAREVYVPDPPNDNTVVMDVGHHEATVQLRLGTATPGERYEKEQELIDLFLETPLKPGVLMTDVTACVLLGPFRCAWVLDDDDWGDERAFSSEYYSTISLTGTIPALVSRADAYAIDPLQLSTTEDQDQTIFNDPPAEVVEINEDGTISPPS